MGNNKLNTGSQFKTNEDRIKEAIKELNIGYNSYYIIENNYGFISVKEVTKKQGKRLLEDKETFESDIWK